MIEKFRWLAGVVAAHKGRCVVGRTRLQKTVKLLQRKRFPTDFRYTIFFYGPYSEGLHADIGLLDRLGLVHEEEKTSHEGNIYYVLTASPDAELPEIDRFRPMIKRMSEADAVVLELAATYDAFRELGADHTQAIERLRRKKGTKCAGGNEEAALALLRDLVLPSG
jgi:uncharacterized protein YwgA